MMLFTEAVPNLQPLLLDPKLWVNVDLQRVFWINAEIIALLEQNASHVSSICLNSPNYLLYNRVELCEVLCLMTNVTSMDLSMCNLIEDMKFLLFMTRLKHLVLDCMSILTTDSLLMYLPQCKSIETLSIKGNNFLTMDEVTTTCCQLVNLKWLDTQGCCDFTPGNVTNILESCPQLHTFLFNSFYYSRMYYSWVSLVNDRFPHVTFHYTTYQQVTRFERLLAREVNL